MRLSTEQALHFAAVESIDKIDVFTAENATRIVQAMYHEIFGIRVDFDEAYRFVLTRKRKDGMPKYEPACRWTGGASGQEDDGAEPSGS
jgi:hypothetical protein